MALGDDLGHLSQQAQPLHITHQGPVAVNGFPLGLHTWLAFRGISICFLFSILYLA